MNLLILLFCGVWTTSFKDDATAVFHKEYRQASEFTSKAYANFSGKATLTRKRTDRDRDPFKENVEFAVNGANYWVRSTGLRENVRWENIHVSTTRDGEMFTLRKNVEQTNYDVVQVFDPKIQLEENVRFLVHYGMALQAPLGLYFPLSDALKKDGCKIQYCKCKTVNGKRIVELQYCNSKFPSAPVFLVQLDPQRNWAILHHKITIVDPPKSLELGNPAAVSKDGKTYDIQYTVEYGETNPSSNVPFPKSVKFRDLNGEIDLEFQEISAECADQERFLLNTYTSKGARLLKKLPG